MEIVLFGARELTWTVTVIVVPWTTDAGAEMLTMRAKAVETERTKREKRNDAEEQCMGLRKGCEEVAKGRRLMSRCV